MMKTLIVALFATADATEELCSAGFQLSTGEADATEGTGKIKCAADKELAAATVKCKAADCTKTDDEATCCVAKATTTKKAAKNNSSSDNAVTAGLVGAFAVTTAAVIYA
jgi:hypothetical protein